MEHIYSGLDDLLQHNPDARSYFESLPPDVRTAMQGENVCTFGALKSQSNEIIHAAF